MNKKTPKRRYNTEVVLSSLLNGLTIKVNEKFYVMNEDNQLLLVLEGEDNKGFILDYSLKDFIDWCEKISEVDRICIIAQKTLLSQNKER